MTDIGRLKIYEGGEWRYAGYGLQGESGYSGYSGVSGYSGYSGVGVDYSILNPQTGTSYEIAASDAGKVVTLDNVSPITVTIRTNADVPIAIGTRIDLVQIGAGKVTFGGAGVTILSKASNKAIAAQYVGASLVKSATDTWLLIGDLIA